MADVNSMYQARMRSDDIKGHIEKLEGLTHASVVHPTVEAFDAEAEAMLATMFGGTHQYVESYKYATLGEAERS